MTNDQKFQKLINDTARLLDALDKAEQTGSIMHRDAAKKLRRELRVWLLANRTVKVATQPPVPRKKKVNQNNFAWLAQ